MRLIDADKIEDYLENICETETETHCMVNLLTHLDEIPTIYDVDKVVEQLVDLIQGSTNEYGDGYNTAITQAIEIIKKGGTKSCSNCKNNIEFPPPHTCDICTSLDEEEFCMWSEKED